MGNSTDVVEQREPQDRAALEAPVGKKYGVLSRLRSYLYFDPLIWLITVLLGIASIPFGFFDKDGSILHAFASLWAKLTMRSIFSPLRVIGLDQVDTSKPHVYAVNHASALDIPVLYAYLPFQFRIVLSDQSRNIIEFLKRPLLANHDICDDLGGACPTLRQFRKGRLFRVWRLAFGISGMCAELL